MKNTHNFSHDEEKWEKSELGASEKHVRKVSTERENNVDDALDLQVISIRLQKELIENLKNLAKNEGIGYQPLIRQVLTRYVRDNLQGQRRFY